MTSPSVFISYSWDSESHKAWVLNLANRLTENGVDVKLDQYDLKLGRNLTHYMERAVEEVDKVVMIFTENYKLKAEGRTGGVGYEYSMINAEWYKRQTDNVKFIPILRSGTNETAVPIFAGSYTFGDMRNDKVFEKRLEELLRTIYDAPEITRPPKGPKPDFLSNKSSDPQSTTQPFTPTDDLGPIENAMNALNGIHALKKELNRLLGEDKIKQAINLLQQFAANERDADLQNTLVLLSSRFNRLNKRLIDGTIAEQQASIEQNRINQALLSIMDSY